MSILEEHVVFDILQTLPLEGIIIDTHDEDRGEEQPHGTLPFERMNQEDCWDFVTLSCDPPPCAFTTTVTYQEYMTQAQEHQRREIQHRYTTLKKQDPEPPTEIDATSFLDLPDNTGIKCPKCQQYNVRYILRQKRSADEGMTADCKCRNEMCLLQFQMKT